MEYKKIPPKQNSKPAGASQLGVAPKLTQAEADFVPSAAEVSRRAYFSYVNQGSKSGRDVQHWLEAEADLLAERNLTRVHGFHNKT
jgi:hypothetical protein